MLGASRAVRKVPSCGGGQGSAHVGGRCLCPYAPLGRRSCRAPATECALAWRQVNVRTSQRANEQKMRPPRFPPVLASARCGAIGGAAEVAICDGSRARRAMLAQPRRTTRQRVAHSRICEAGYRAGPVARRAHVTLSALSPRARHGQQARGAHVAAARNKTPLLKAQTRVWNAGLQTTRRTLWALPPQLGHYRRNDTRCLPGARCLPSVCRIFAKVFARRLPGPLRTYI
jgi:hypothetical protein